MTASARSPYFVSAPVDFLCIGGFSILLFLAMLPFSVPRTSWVIHTAAILTWLCNWPHFAATNVRLYHTRENIAQYPVTALAIPVLVTAAAVWALADPVRVAPLLVKLFLFWSSYHYSGQSLGISLAYAKRSGVAIGQAERFALSGFIFGTFLYSIARSEVGCKEWPPNSYFGVTIPVLHLPLWVATVAGMGLILCAAALVVLVVRWSVLNRRIFPLIVLLPAAAQFVWFLLGWRVPGFNEFVPFFHGTQYLLIAWAMQLKEKMDLGQVLPSSRYVALETGRWGMTIFLLGAFLFWVLPRVAASAGHPLSLAEPVVIAAVQIHHFFVDGVIWKLRNPKIGSALLVNIDDLRGSRAGLLQPA